MLGFQVGIKSFPGAGLLTEKRKGKRRSSQQRRHMERKEGGLEIFKSVTTDLEVGRGDESRGWGRLPKVVGERGTPTWSLIKGQTRKMLDTET